ncbi:hypothetical protein I314_02543 [Cryptococcus bacillisporus CA1873]|uniref:C3H1-type domain-containing protein n=1 Tax=Cryptococcus bacillisporus CA1873 TaxID=1296111 RepID=A0ABR5BDS3_CRYGA|nr:hypothetical protein I314_02543 [Cryptococcus bacillisporus CA1873]|eukprot:KIR67325.1 hypothetical protein I314_02543 [Cryptococcus gattii CA1873]
MARQFTSEQSAQLQSEVQAELERREWAEPNDNVMAEYITVLLANGSSRERVQSEMDDLVGSDFDPAFLDWLFVKSDSVISDGSPNQPVPTPVEAEGAPLSTAAPRGNSRLLSSALAPLTSQPEKRKLSDSMDDGQNKRPASEVPVGPRLGTAAPRSPNMPTITARGRGMGIRGTASGGRGSAVNYSSVNGNFTHQQPSQQIQPGFRFRQQMHPGRFNQQIGGPGMLGMPNQQEMMAQMMMMQANMAQMGQMMSMMVGERQHTPFQRQQPSISQSGYQASAPAPVKLPPGTKLGSHSISSITPKSSNGGPVPDKPTSVALCKFGVGCSNARCPYSHPSPVADEKTGMVLSEEACEKGKECKDPECIKSHVSPSAVLGGTGGPSRLLCKYQNCNNPSCPFRHEDADGNPAPPPALAKNNKPTVAKAPASSSDDGSVEVINSQRGLLDDQLADGPKMIQCRFGGRCTRADCKFLHPASRSSVNAEKPLQASHTHPGNTTISLAGGMSKSKKFGADGKQGGLNPDAVEFKPTGHGEDKNGADLNVTL